MESSIRFGCGISLRLPTETAMYMASPGMADPKLVLRGRGPNLHAPMLQFDRCVFRFQPASNTASGPRGGTGGSRSANPSGQTKSDGTNKEDDPLAARGKVTYGRVVHLVHVYSGLYVTMVRKPAESDPSHFRVALMTLEDAGSACRFKVLPRYKIRDQGDVVCDKDVIFLQQETGNLSLNAVFTSQQLQAGGANFFNDDLGGRREVTAAEEPTSFEIGLYDDTTLELEQQRHPVLGAGAAALLFHREKDALLTIPTSVTALQNDLKGRQPSSPSLQRKPSSAPGKLKSGSGANLAGPTAPKDSSSNLAGLRRYVVPFFKHLENPVATLSLDSLEYGSNALWFFENLDPTLGGPIPTNAPVRIRHGATGMYLVASRGIASTTFEFQLQELVTKEHFENSLYHLELVASSLHSPMIHSTKTFLRVKHPASGLYISTNRTGPHSSALTLTPQPNLEDTLVVILVPKKEHHDLSFLIGNIEFLQHYIRNFYEMQSPKAELTPKSPTIARVVARAETSLSALIRFCTSSDDDDPLTREGLPIAAHQQSMFEVSLHKTAMEVLLCPFVGYAKENKMELPLTGGVLSMEEILQPEYANIHKVCRLCYRLLKQMSKGSPYAAQLVEYVDFMQAQEGYKLHVADTLMEIFTDNPNLPPSRMETDIRHFVHLLLTKGRSSGYLKFLSALCVVKDVGITLNQRLVCSLILGQHRDDILLPTVEKEGQIMVLVPKTKEKKAGDKKDKSSGDGEKKEKKKEKDADGADPAGEPKEKKEKKEKDDGGDTGPQWQNLAHFLINGDSKMVKFYEASIELLGALCIGADRECVEMVERVISREHILSAIRSTFPASDGLRASYFSLTHHLYVRRILHADAMENQTKGPQIVGALVLSTEVANKSFIRDSGNGDDDLDALAATVSLSMHDHGNFLDDVKKQSLSYLAQHKNTSTARGANDLIVRIANIWHAVVSHRRASHEELVAVVGAVMDILDGRTDKIRGEERYVCNEVTMTLMTTKIALCNFLLAVLQSSVFEVADNAVANIASSATNAVNAAEAQIDIITNVVFQRSRLFPILLDLLLYQETLLVSIAFDLMVSICNAGGFVAERIANAESISKPAAVRALQLFSSVSSSLSRNMTTSGRVMNEEALCHSIEKIIRFDFSSGVAVPLGTAGGDGSPTPAVSSGTKKLQAKVQSIIAVNRVFGAVQERRSKWRIEDNAESKEFSRLLYRSGLHETMLTALEQAGEGSELQAVLLEFFHILSRCDEAAVALGGHMDVLLKCLRNENCVFEAASIILRVLKADKTLANSMEEDTIGRLVALLAASKDAMIGEGLEHLVLGEYPIAANQKAVLSFLIAHQLTRGITDANKTWPAAQLSFNSSIVDLMACCCVGNSACRTIATKLLRPHEVMRVLVADNLPHAHMVPFFKFLCSAFLAAEDELTAQELLLLKKQWTEDAQWWSLMSTVMLPALSITSVGMTPEQMELVFGGILPAMTCYYLNHYSPQAAAKCKVVVSITDVIRKLVTFSQAVLDSSFPVSEAFTVALHQTLTAVLTHAEVSAPAELTRSLVDAAGKIHSLAQQVAGADPESGEGSTPANGQSQRKPGVDSKMIAGASAFKEKWQEYSSESLAPLVELWGGGMKISQVPDHKPDLVVLHRKMIQHLYSKDFSERATLGVLATLKWAVLQCESDEKEFAEAQVYANTIGALRMITEVISNSTDRVTVEAFNLAIAILEGGNKGVQDQLLSHFTNYDERFFHDVGTLIDNAIELAQQHRARALHGTFYSRAKRSKLAFKHIQKAFRFLQLMCEGHHLGLQDYLREQSDNLRNVNIVREIVRFLGELVVEDPDPDHFDLLLQTLALLTEFCQGPCVGNQRLIAQAGVCGLLNQLLVGPGFAFSTGLAANEAISLEDPKVATLLSIKRSAVTTILALLEGCIDEEIPMVVLTEIPVAGLEKLLEQMVALPEFKDASNEDACELVYSIVITLLTVVQSVTSKSNKARIEAQALLDAYTSHVGMLGRIEIERGERIEKVYFRVPTICSILSEESKQKLLWSIDRSTQGSKLSDFLDKTDELIFDMEATHRVTEQMANNKLLTLSSQISLKSWDDLSLGLALVINVLFLLVISDVRGLMDSTTEWFGLEGLLRILSGLQCAVTIFSSILDSTLHFPLILYKLSKEVENPTPLQKARVLALSRPETLYRLTMCLAAVLGITVSAFFFAVHLLSFIAKSAILMNVVVAITQNGKSLVLTGMLGGIVTYLFSIVAFVYFQEHFEDSCGTLSQCFIHILSTGLRQGGGIGDAMTDVKHSDPNYFPRLFFDMLFWAFLIVIFLNILFGIIIDTFAELRDEKSKKEEDMRTKCTICGIDSYTFDRYGEGFTKHVKEEHNLWQYLYFFHHLRRKEKSEYTGQESYVASCVANGDISFFPAGRSSSLRDHKKSFAGDDGGEEEGGDDLTEAALMHHQHANTHTAKKERGEGSERQTDPHRDNASEGGLSLGSDPSTVARILAKLDAIQKAQDQALYSAGADSKPLLGRNRGVSLLRDDRMGAGSPLPYSSSATSRGALEAELASITNQASFKASTPVQGAAYLELERELNLSRERHLDGLRMLHHLYGQSTVALYLYLQQTTELLETFQSIKRDVFIEYVAAQTALLVGALQQSYHSNSLLAIQLDGVRAQREAERERSRLNVMFPSVDGSTSAAAGGPGSSRSLSAASTERIGGSYAATLKGIMQEGETYMAVLRQALRESRSLSPNGELNGLDGYPTQ